MRYIALFLLFFATVVTRSFADGLPQSPYIYVIGEGKITVFPDRITLEAGIESKDEDSKKAKDELTEKSVKFYQLMKKLGLEEKSVVSESVTISILRDREAKKDYYRTFQSFWITVTDINNADGIINGIMESALCSKFAVSKIYSSKENDLQDVLLAKALENARVKADKIAAATDSKVLSVFAVSPVDFTRIKESMLFKTWRNVAAGGWGQPGNAEITLSITEKTLSLDVHVIFLIEPAK